MVDGEIEEKEALEQEAKDKHLTKEDEVLELNPETEKEKIKGNRFVEYFKKNKIDAVVFGGLLLLIIIAWIVMS